MRIGSLVILLITLSHADYFHPSAIQNIERGLLHTQVLVIAALDPNRLESIIAVTEIIRKSDIRLDWIAIQTQNIAQKRIDRMLNQQLTEVNDLPFTISALIYRIIQVNSQRAFLGENKVRVIALESRANENAEEIYQKFEILRRSTGDFSNKGIVFGSIQSSQLWTVLDHKLATRPLKIAIHVDEPWADKMRHYEPEVRSIWRTLSRQPKGMIIPTSQVNWSHRGKQAAEAMSWLGRFDHLLNADIHLSWVSQCRAIFRRTN